MQLPDRVHAEKGKTAGRRGLFVFIRVVAFLCVCSFAFLHLSHLMRPKTTNHENIEGYYAEPSQTIDVICIGGSSTFVYWIPMQAWSNYGMSSYNWAGNGMPASVSKLMVAEALKTQTPDLFVIDIRALYISEDGGFSHNNIRNYTDFLNYSVNRATGIEYALKRERRNISPSERLMMQLDFIRYHSEWRTRSETSYKMAVHQYEQPYKGMHVYVRHEVQTLRDTSHITEKSSLSEIGQQTLVDLLEYCESRDLEVLFVVTPYVEQEEERALFNYAGEIIKEYGYTFIDTNDYYDEMQLDAAIDFYNEGHVNVFGAEKYTSFLSSYINENFSIADHREDFKYYKWHDNYITWCVYLDEKKEEIIALINGDTLPDTTADDTMI